MKLTKAIHSDIPELVELLRTLFEQEAVRAERAMQKIAAGQQELRKI
jgi:N-acetylglutamate synthase-like GNAT family acetyltransferase